MQLFVGTSGYSYPKWKGSFYPAKLPQKEMLSYYAQRFSTVEINNSFYRMPTEEALESWAEQVPDGFRFALKAPQAITHYKRLKGAEEETRTFLHAVAALQGQQGPLLFQLPPNFKKDLARLDSFLDLLSGNALVAVELRHESWLDEDVFACLRAHACVLCAADTDEAPVTKLTSTSEWGYVRLRREKYTAQELRKWLALLKSQEWKSAYVFFKHEDTGTGPKFAARFLELAE